MDVTSKDFGKIILSSVPCGWKYVFERSSLFLPADKLQKKYKDVADLINKLQALSDEEFRKIADESDTIFEEWNDKVDQECNDEFSYPFNKKEAMPDFDFIASLPQWTYVEAAAYSINRKPEYFAINDGDYVFTVDKPDYSRSIAFQRYQERLHWFERLVQSKQLGARQKPWKYVEKAASRDISFPPDLFKLVMEYKERDEEKVIDPKDIFIEELKKENAQLKTRPEAKKEKPLSTRERETLLKIIISMAVRTYGYKPSDKKSKAPNAISKETDWFGISVTAETIREKLDDATELLSTEAKERIEKGEMKLEDVLG